MTSSIRPGKNRLRDLFDAERLARARRAEHGDGQRPWVLGLAVILPDERADTLEPLDLMAVHCQELAEPADRHILQRLLRALDHNAERQGLQAAGIAVFENRPVPSGAPTATRAHNGP